MQFVFQNEKKIMTICSKTIIDQLSHEKNVKKKKRYLLYSSQSVICRIDFSGSNKVSKL